VFKGVVWAGVKLLAGVVLIISFGPSSCAGKVGAYVLNNGMRKCAMSLYGASMSNIVPRRLCA